MQTPRGIALQVTAFILLLILPLNSALAIGESPDAYDMRHGLPSESSAERTYLTEDLKVTVFFSQDAAVGVRYVGIFAETNSKIIPRELTQQEIEAILSNHDANDAAWIDRPAIGQKRIWGRADGGATAFTEDNMVLVVFDSRDPPWWWEASDNVGEVREDNAVDVEALRNLSDRVIRSRVTPSVTFVGRDDVVNRDGSEVYLFQYKVDDSELITRVEGITMISYELITVQFHPNRGLSEDKAVIGRGRVEESIASGWEEKWRDRPTPSAGSGHN